jgi:hypothetical protein
MGAGHIPGRTGEGPDPQMLPIPVPKSQTLLIRGIRPGPPPTRSDSPDMHATILLAPGRGRHAEQADISRLPGIPSGRRRDLWNGIRVLEDHAALPRAVERG